MHRKVHLQKVNELFADSSLELKPSVADCAECWLRPRSIGAAGIAVELLLLLCGSEKCIGGESFHPDFVAACCCFGADFDWISWCATAFGVHFFGASGV